LCLFQALPTPGIKNMSWISIKHSFRLFSVP
jgi:hypothetical protein